MNSLADHIAQLWSEWNAIRDLCCGISAEVLTHVVGVEHVLTGWVPSIEQPPPFARMEEFAAEADGLCGADLLAMCDAVMAARLAELGAMDPSVVDEPSVTPTGIGTYGGFLRVRVFDFWIHHRDMAGPLGTTTDDSWPAAETALAEASQPTCM